MFGQSTIADIERNVERKARASLLRHDARHEKNTEARASQYTLHLRIPDGRPIRFRVLVLVGACRSGTVWAGLCSTHHHQRHVRHNPDADVLPATQVALSLPTPRNSSDTTTPPRPHDHHHRAAAPPRKGGGRWVCGARGGREPGDAAAARVTASGGTLIALYGSVVPGTGMGAGGTEDGRDAAPMMMPPVSPRCIPCTREALDNVEDGWLSGSGNTRRRRDRDGRGWCSMVFVRGI